MDPLEWIYHLGYKASRSMGRHGARKLPVRVVSIGNITVGGTGKTPSTIVLAAEAFTRGQRPCVLTRGYGGRLKGPVLVGPHLSVGDVGDEAMLIATALPHVPVIKCADRYKAGMFALKELRYEPDMFILDDGFQHWRLERDLDVVLINSMNPFHNGKLLPTGRLREPLSELKRAGAIVLTHADESGSIEELRTRVQALCPDCRVFYSSHRPTVLRTSDGEVKPLDSLKGVKVYAIAGIASPGAFFDSLSRLGANVVGTISYRDHHMFTEADVTRMVREAEESSAKWIITTEKDIMRLRPYASLIERFISMGVEFQVDRAFLDFVLGPGPQQGSDNTQ